MSRPSKLTDEEVESRLGQLPEWTILSSGEIGRTFDFGERGKFLGAVAFVGAVAPLAEEMQHHPDIDIRYAKVTFRLITHDAGGLTAYDFDLAHKIDRLYASRTAEER